MADAALQRMNREEFLAWDAEQADRYEFIGGEIYAMTGGTRDHDRITFNIRTQLHAALSGTRCRAVGDALKVEAHANYTYPDVVVTCEPMGPRSLFVTQPRLIVEVLSPSTEARDRGEKWMAYQTLPSLEYYVLVSQTAVRVEVFTRAANGWGYAAFGDPTVRVEFPSLDIGLDLTAIYEGCFTVDPGAETAVAP